jgi:hypothetical protein
MTNYERIRNQTVEEMAKIRVNSCHYPNETRHFYGDFGCVEAENHTADALMTAYAEALRLEMEWLNSEEEKK